MDINARLELFGEMVLCCHNLYLSIYDGEFTLLGGSFPDETSFYDLFSLGNISEFTAQYMNKHSRPIILSNDLGMMWSAIPEKEDETLKRIHILGPFFLDGSTVREIENRLRGRELSGIYLKSVTELIRELPVVSINRIFEYTIMLYYCITGEKISVSDINFQENEAGALPKKRSSGKTDIHGTYEMEREMVRMVREGNLGFMRHMDRLAMTGILGKLSNGEPTRQMKNAVLVCTVLFSRAAIEGGLAPEIAMTLTDRYFQGVEACRNLPELNDISSTMQNDFVSRVHKVKTSRLTKPVMECCDYIDLHVEEDLTLGELAERLKYSANYLGRKFKAEVGTGFNEYIRLRKLERAKTLLRDNSLSVKDVSETLNFCTHSYFAESFRAAYGMTPSEWRERRE